MKQICKVNVKAESCVLISELSVQYCPKRCNAFSKMQYRTASKFLMNNNRLCSLLYFSHILTSNEVVIFAGYLSLEKSVRLPSISNKLMETTLLTRLYNKFEVSLLKVISPLELRDVKTPITTCSVDIK